VERDLSDVRHPPVAGRSGPRLPLRATTSRVILAGLLLILCGAGTLGVWRLTSGLGAGRGRQQFDIQVREFQLLVRTRVSACAEMLDSAQGLFAASRSVDRREWRLYVDTQELRTRFPGLQAVEFAERVRLPDKEAFTTAVRADTSRQDGGYPGFRVSPEGERPEYVVVKFIEPMEGNDADLGYDLASDPERQAALEQATDTGQASLTRRIRLTRDRVDQPGFLLVVPVYLNGAPVASIEERRAAILGFVVGALRARDLLREMIGPGDLFPGVDCEVFDGKEPLLDRLLYDRDGLPDAHRPGPDRFRTTVSMQAAGRTWTFCFSARDTFGRNPIAEVIPVLVVVCGVALSFLLSGIVLSQAVSRARARTLARQTARLVESEARFRGVLDAAVDAVITIDARGIMNTFNSHAERMFGYTVEEVVGRNVSMLMPSPYREQHDGHLARYLGTGERKVLGTSREVLARRKDGATFPADLSLSEVVLPGRRMFTGSIRDITDRKRGERLKDEFVSTVNYELRTPLTSILGSLGLLMGGAAGTLPKPVEVLLGIAMKNCERLVRLINDILDVDHMESGELALQLRTVDLRPLILQAIEANVPYARQFGARLSGRGLTAGLSVEADPDRILQVMTNLLSNAVKFSPPEGTVEVTAERVEGGIRVSVTDHGQGIPAGFQARVFQKFAQADASISRQRGGTGLGLSIAKAIVERHGGRIGFETRSGEGTCFWFVLPVHAAVPQREPEGMAKPAGAEME